MEGESAPEKPNGGGGGGGNNEEGGDWCTIAQKKTKKKKKLRPVPLKDFFSSDHDDHGGNVHTELIRTSGGALRAASPLGPDLVPEEEVVAVSLRAYFADLLKRLGPVRVDNAKLNEELEGLEEDARKIIDKFSSLSLFLVQSEDVQVVDNYLCSSGDVLKAKALAIETIVNNVINVKKASASAAPLVPNPWARGVPSSTSDPFSAPRVDSLFSTGVVSMSPIKRAVSPPDISLPPPPIQKPTSSASASNLSSFFSSSLPSSSLVSGFGGIGTVSNIGSSSVSTTRVGGVLPMRDEVQQQAMVESLSKRLQGLAKCNSELLLQLQEKEKQIFKLNQMVSNLEERCKAFEKFQLKSTMEVKKNGGGKEEPAKFPVTVGSGGPLTESQLIIQLQKQLESEKLNAQSLKQQLEIERMYSARLADKQSPVMSMSSFINGHVSSSSSLMPSSHLSNGSGLRGEDSLGLRGLLSVTAKMPSLNSTSSGLGNGNGLGTIRPSSGPIPSLGFLSNLSMGESSLFEGGSSGGGGSAGVGETPAATMKKILELINIQYPDVTELELERYLRQLRSLHGRLSGMPLQKVIILVKSLIEKERQRTT